MSIFARVVAPQTCFPFFQSFGILAVTLDACYERVEFDIIYLEWNTPNLHVNEQELELSALTKAVPPR